MGDLHGRVRSIGGVFDNYALVQGGSNVPVDVYVLGARRARVAHLRHRPAPAEDCAAEARVVRSAWTPPR